jgi:DeoR/GlpR family transcriptional regulator of sugar metabolism
VLVDHEKFGRVSSVTFAGIEDASIITNRADNPQYRQYTAIKEVDL